ncbi:GNAT family N-acetyltransferase [Metabacillus arenae]|uniref:GNAT family N-acetyltransferase n=1 Tax=Metabacillus arenae TaxID=2771434 RepID=A0A926RX56_9BACI|nr:GNAT family protein [Metabacillus arenae]MBD1380641.1 GNAT family N-acetyltransferase [Metabacillus arenae]
MKILLDELTGERVQIVPMEKSHIQGLYDIGNNGNIWIHLPKIMQTPNDMESFVEEALENKKSGKEFPFVIILRESDKIIGTTRFLEISNKNNSLEIGWTWLTPTVWGSQINTECKYLLLKYCFESMEVIRVQFKTDEKNVRSQKAIERIGGVKEGILRNHMIRKDGSFRNSVFYSIIESDWASVKQKLEGILEQGSQKSFT